MSIDLFHFIMNLLEIFCSIFVSCIIFSWVCSKKNYVEKSEFESLCSHLNIGSKHTFLYYPDDNNEINCLPTKILVYQLTDMNKKIKHLEKHFGIKLQVREGYFEVEDKDVDHEKSSQGG